MAVFISDILMKCFFEFYTRKQLCSSIDFTSVKRLIKIEVHDRVQ